MITWDVTIGRDGTVRNGAIRLVRPPYRIGSYRKLSHRDLLRWGDQYKTTWGRWRPVYGPATGSNHTVGMHPYPGTEYRRPIKVVR